MIQLAYDGDSYVICIKLPDEDVPTWQSKRWCPEPQTPHSPGVLQKLEASLLTPFSSSILKPDLI